MAIPKKHLPRVAKFTELVLGLVVREETPRVFYRKGALDANYQISLYSTGLLPQGNDDTIEISGKVNDKEIGKFYIKGSDIASHTVDKQLVKDVTDAFAKIRIKEMK